MLVHYIRRKGDLPSTGLLRATSTKHAMQATLPSALVHVFLELGLISGFILGLSLLNRIHDSSKQKRMG